MFLLYFDCGLSLLVCLPFSIYYFFFKLALSLVFFSKLWEEVFKHNLFVKFKFSILNFFSQMWEEVLAFLVGVAFL